MVPARTENIVIFTFAVSLRQKDLDGQVSDTWLLKMPIINIKAASLGIAEQKLLSRLDATAFLYDITDDLVWYVEATMDCSGYNKLGGWEVSTYGSSHPNPRGNNGLLWIQQTRRLEVSTYGSSNNE